MTCNISLITSSVAAPSISTAALVATSWSIAIVIALVAAAATAATTPEAALPVVKAFLWGRAGFAALLVVLLQETLGLVALHLHEGHLLQEVANLRESKVGLGGWQCRPQEGWVRGGVGFHPSWVGWDERERGREEGRGCGFVVKTRAVTPPGQKKKKRRCHYHAGASETSLRSNADRWRLMAGRKEQTSPPGKGGGKICLSRRQRGEISWGGGVGEGKSKGQLRGWWEEKPALQTEYSRCDTPTSKTLQHVTARKWAIWKHPLQGSELCKSSRNITLLWPRRGPEAQFAVHRQKAVWQVANRRQKK